MLQKIVLVLVLSMLCSCSSIKKEYYVYEDEKTNSYCTFELHRSKKDDSWMQVYYRAVSDYYDGGKKDLYEWEPILNDDYHPNYPGYANDIEGHDVLFVYLHSRDIEIPYELDSTLSKSISIKKYFDGVVIEAYTGKSFTKIMPMRLDKEGQLDAEIYHTPILFMGHSYVLYIRESRDSLRLIWTQNIKKEFLNETSFAMMEIDWFPPYIKRVKKIEYKKFNLRVKKKYLKDPFQKNAPVIGYIQNEKRLERLYKKQIKRNRRDYKRKQRKQAKEDEKQDKNSS